MITIKQASKIYRKTPQNIRSILIGRGEYKPLGFVEDFNRKSKQRAMLLGFDEDVIDSIFSKFKKLPRGSNKKYGRNYK
jgi:hypothetical protein